MGALDRGGHIEMLQCDPWFSLGGAQLGGQDRPAGVGGQLTLLALGGELGCHPRPPGPQRPGQFHSPVSENIPSG